MPRSVPLLPPLPPAPFVGLLPPVSVGLLGFVPPPWSPGAAVPELPLLLGLEGVPGAPLGSGGVEGLVVVGDGVGFVVSGAGVVVPPPVLGEVEPPDGAALPVS
jgi:hypothetical protein